MLIGNIHVHELHTNGKEQTSRIIIIIIIIIIINCFANNKFDQNLSVFFLDSLVPPDSVSKILRLSDRKSKMTAMAAVLKINFAFLGRKYPADM